jgi:hypothetical protein
MADETATVKLTFDASAALKGYEDLKRASDGVMAQFRAVQDAVSKASKANDEIGKSTQRTVEALGGQNRFLAQAARAYDPFSAAVQKAKADVDRLNGVITAGGPNSARAAQLLGPAMVALADAQRRVETQTTASSHAMSNSVVSAGQLRFAVQNLAYQVNDIATSLASGSSPFRVLAQQSGQVVQAFSQGGGVTAVLGGFGRTIAGLINPITLSVAAVAGLAAGFGILISRASDSADNVRTFDLQLRTMGTSGATSGAALQSLVQHLRDTGIAAADAKKALDLVTFGPGVNPGAAGLITDTARNILAQRGGDFVDTVKSLTAALQGGTEGIIGYAFSLGTLTADQAAAIRRTGDLRIGLDAINSAIPNYTETLGKGANAVRSLSAAWGDFLDRLANSSIIQATVDGLTKLLDALSSAGKVLSEQQRSEAAQRATLALPQPGAPPQRPGYASAGPYAPIGAAAPFPTLANPAGQPLVFDRPPTASDMAHGFGGIADRHDAGAAPVTIIDQAAIDKIRQHAKELQNEITISKEFAGTADIVAARIKATTEAEKLFTDAGQRSQYVEDAVAAAVAKHGAELGKQATVAELAARGAAATAAAYQQSAVAGIQAAAAAKATRTCCRPISAFRKPSIAP